MKIKSILSIALAVFLLLGTFTGCEVIDLNEVLTINGEVVTGGVFNFMLDTFKNEIANEMGFDAADKDKWTTEEIDNRKAIELAKEKTIDEIVLIWVQAQKAEAEGITLTADEAAYADSSLTSYAEQNFGTMAAFDKQLSEWQVTKDAVRDLFKKLVLVSKLQQKYITEDATMTDVTDDEVLAQYEKVKEEYLGNSVMAKHILVLFEDASKGISRTKDEAKKEAQAILDRINAGEDFEELMYALSEDSEVSYDGYSFTHGDGQFVPEFDNGAYELEVGAVSGLIETQYGYHIIKRYPSTEEFYAFEDVKEDLKTEVAYERYNAMVKDTWVAEAKVDKNTKVLDKIK